MPFPLSDRTSSRSAVSTISRLVLSRVSLRALRTKLSSISIFVLPISKACTICENLVYIFPFFGGLYFQLSTFNFQLSTVNLWRPLTFSTDFHNSFESHPSRKPFPLPNLNPTVSNSDAHSNNNIVILDSRYFLCYHVLCKFVPILDFYPTVSRRPRCTISPLQHYVLFFLPHPFIPSPEPVGIEDSGPARTFRCSNLWTFQRSLESPNPLESMAIFRDF